MFVIDSLMCVACSWLFDVCCLLCVVLVFWCLGVFCVLLEVWRVIFANCCELVVV